MSWRTFPATRALLIVAALHIASPAIVAAPIDSNSLNEAAAYAYRKAMLASAKPGGDAEIAARARQVANRVLASAASREPDATRWNWSITVFPGDAPELIVYPGGRLLMSAGLVARTGFADEEIGAVIAQGVAHLLLRHPDNRLALVQDDELASPDPNRRMIAWAVHIDKAAREPAYTAQEIVDADALSVELLAGAAYEPSAAGSAWRRLGREPNPIARAQPVTPERIAALDAAVRQARPLYEQAKAKANSAPRPPPPGRMPPRR
jgi:predicted Zn-dependent protease